MPTRRLAIPSPLVPSYADSWNWTTGRFKSNRTSPCAAPVDSTLNCSAAVRDELWTLRPPLPRLSAQRTVLQQQRDPSARFSLVKHVTDVHTAPTASNRICGDETKRLSGALCPILLFDFAVDNNQLSNFKFFSGAFKLMSVPDSFSARSGSRSDSEAASSVSFFTPRGRLLPTIPPAPTTRTSRSLFKIFSVFLRLFSPLSLTRYLVFRRIRHPPRPDRSWNFFSGASSGTQVDHPENRNHYSQSPRFIRMMLVHLTHSRLMWSHWYANFYISTNRRVIVQIKSL